jgi:hypothetical protein
MNEVAQLLDVKLKTLDRERALKLEKLVREAIEQIDRQATPTDSLGWPEGYFDETAGAFADEEFERGDQGTLPTRDDW